MGSVCGESRVHPDFLGDGWWETMDVIMKQAGCRGMKVWVLDDAHFPTGYANGKVAENPFAARKLVVDEARDKKSAIKFINLVERYADFTELTPVVLNEFVDKIVVHERDRKGRVDSTQKIEIYFNFIGEYRPSTMREPELSAEALEEIRQRR